MVPLADELGSVHFTKVCLAGMPMHIPANFYKRPTFLASQQHPSTRIEFNNISMIKRLHCRGCSKLHSFRSVPSLFQKPSTYNVSDSASIGLLQYCEMCGEHLAPG